MKLPMIGLISFAAGSATAAAVAIGMNTFSADQHKEERLNDLMYAQLISDGKGSKPAPPGMLPLDALPEPGVPQEPGSARPQIMIQPGVVPPKNSARPGAKLVLVKSDKTVESTKDPIWELQLVGNDNTVLQKLPALTGRVNKQTANRDIAGNKSPLPKGVYVIDKAGIESGPFEDPELGRGYWIPITPMFRTNRSALGFHQDPSWGKRNGESGTSGCIGLESADATMTLLSWIRHFNIQRLYVES